MSDIGDRSESSPISRKKPLRAPEDVGGIAKVLQNVQEKKAIVYALVVCQKIFNRTHKNVTIKTPRVTGNLGIWLHAVDGHMTMLHQEPTYTPAPATYVEDRCAPWNPFEHHASFAGGRLVHGVARMRYRLSSNVSAPRAHVTRS
jgi:hypothetical protein